MYVSPSDQVIRYLSDALEAKEADVTDKVQRASEILRGDPSLLKKAKIVACLQLFRDSSIDPKIKGLITNLIPSEDKQETLTFPKKVLDEISKDEAKTEEFWNLILSDAVQRVNIDGEYYGKSTLLRLAELRKSADIPERIPTIKNLTEKVTVKFNDGSSRLITKAKLKLFGEVFINDSENTLSFEAVSPREFDLMLNEVETGKFDSSVDSSEYKSVLDFLDYNRYMYLPENVMGKKILEKYLGDVGKVPTPPKAFFEALEAQCPFSVKGVKKKNTHIALWVPRQCELGRSTPRKIESLINSERAGENQIGFDRELSSFPFGIEDQEIEGGYWLLMYHKPLVSTQGMTYDRAENFIKNTYKNYEIPSLIDVALCSLLTYVCSGEKRERILPAENFINCTWCKERMIAGALGHTGLYVRSCNDAASAIGVCPAQKFK